MLCPVCKTNQTKRVAGACPGCGTAVTTYNGFWYREDLGSPTVALQEFTEKQVSKQLSDHQSTPVTFRVPRKSTRYRRELIVAERLLTMCSGDYELAKEIIIVLFSDPRFGWKTRDGLLSCERDFIIGYTVAIARRAKLSEIEQKAKESIQKVTSREDVFS